MSERYGVKLAVFLVLERDGKVLLARRFNTGWEDGKYNLPSGHVEEGETPIETMVREGKEEIGIDVAAEDLELVNTNFFHGYINLYFRASKWNGDPTIIEHDKCDELIWAPLDNLPDNMAGRGLEVLHAIKDKISYTEHAEK